jgi:hypothetical protein
MIHSPRVPVDSDPIEPQKLQFDQVQQGLMVMADILDALRRVIRTLKPAGGDDEDCSRRASSALSSG